MWAAVILVAAEAATITQDAAVIGADMAVATAAATGMAVAIHITDADTAPALLVA